MKTALLVGLGAIMLVGGFFAINNSIYREKQKAPRVAAYEGTLSGTQTCLPPRDPNAPHTLECELAIQTDTGEYYALDLAAAATPATLTDGSRFSASGTITPIELLSSDHWQKYQVEGVFSVVGGVMVEEEYVPTPSVPEPVRPAKGPCYVGGCSSQLCSDTPDMASTCEYRESYGCYRTATCERQPNGMCGWTPTSELQACLLRTN